MIESNKKIAQRWLTDFWSDGNYAVADETMATDYVRHDPAIPIHSADAYKKFVTIYRDTFPDLEFTCEHLVAEGEKVFIRCERKSHSGKRQVEIRGTDLLRIVDGKTVESWPLFDAFGLL